MSTENRIHKDRRSQPTPLFSRYTFMGRRSQIRRVGDRHVHYYVDAYDRWSVLTVLSTLVLSIADAFFTLYLLERGATELNPLMDLVIGHGPVVFVVIKFALTCAGMIWLVIHKNYYPLGGSYRVGQLMIMIPFLYAVLIAYELRLILSL